MIRQEVAIRHKLVGHREFLSNYTTEVLVVVIFGLVFTKSGGKTDGVIVWRKGDEAFVKGFVVEG